MNTLTLSAKPWRISLGCLGLSALLATSALAQSFPSKTVRIIEPARMHRRRRSSAVLT
jgi:hypothetical protein